MTARAYPLPRPDDDPRFTFGLQLDVAKVLEKHGFPGVHGVDLVDLGQAIFRFLYASEEQPAQLAQPLTEHDPDAKTVHPDPAVEAARQKWLAARQKTRDAYADFQSKSSPVESGRARRVWMDAIQVSNEARWAFEHAREDAEKDRAVLDDSPLTLAEYRSALAYWERKATEAQAAGLRGEFDRRMEGIVSLRKTIRRLAAEGGAQ